MKVVYIADARVPSEKAHPYQILKMCEAFAKTGQVDLVVPSRVQTRKMRRVKDIQQYYAIREKFKIKKLPSIDFLWVNIYIDVPRILQHFAFYLKAISFALFATLYCLFKKADVYYTRDRYFAFFFGYLKFLHRKKIYHEGHTSEPLVSGLVKRGRVDGLIVTAHALKQLYRKEILERKVLVAPHGVDLSMFSNSMPKEEARRKLNLRLKGKIVCYTGHLYHWKGVYNLAISAKYLKALVCFIGGTDKDIQNFKKFVEENNINNVVIVGYVPPITVPMYLSASDVVVLPTLGEDILKAGAMPLKLFEYMASKRPIVASNLPSIREILNEKNAVLVKPGSPEALAEGINRVLNDKALADKLAENAYKDVQQYDWVKRAEKVLEFIRVDAKV